MTQDNLRKGKELNNIIIRKETKEDKHEGGRLEQRLGRVSEIQKSKFTISYWEQELPASLAGSFYKDDKETPVVGDYVTFDYNPYGDSRIVSVCERKSVLKRPDQSGHAIGFVKNMAEQVMIANFDYVFIVTSLNGNYNLNRIARYVSITLQGGGLPVVILTKGDLCEDDKPFIKEVEELSEQVKVHSVSAIRNEGLDALSLYFTPGTTIALLGSSGVGKSTLLNAIAGKELMKTGEIRQSDAKGRHTTTYRQLVTFENGVTIIDTPGMRELGMCDVAEGIGDTFDDIEELTSGCRFSDCRHDTEPGCAIKEALQNGSLSPERWELYSSLKRESNKSAYMKAIAVKRRKINKYGK